MMAKTKTRLRWITLGLVLCVQWIAPFFVLHAPLWKAFWFCLVVVYAGGFWLIFRSDIDTESGLERATNVLLGFVLFQIAVVVFLVVFRSALTR
jgi:hypothetical protein